MSSAKQNTLLRNNDLILETYTFYPFPNKLKIRPVLALWAFHIPIIPCFDRIDRKTNNKGKVEFFLAFGAF
jgi:hypothetical protein